MSRSILKKIYRRNVQLEKELEVAKSNTSEGMRSAIRPEVSTCTGYIESSHNDGSSESRTGGNSDEGDKSLDTSAQMANGSLERLQAALDASRRRGALLEANIITMTEKYQKGHQLKTLRETEEKAALYRHMYERAKKQLTDILNRRVDAFRRSQAGSKDVKMLVAQLKQRLRQEMEERDAESAIHSTQLYDLEKEISDLTVDRSMLQTRVGELQEELRRRGRLDGDIEACVRDMVDRLKALESENKVLKAQGE
eukprot:evm.model.scf_48.17 EVM.evm.TU.scf_48.17   scf_48:120622-123792(-)